MIQCDIPEQDNNMIDYLIHLESDDIFLSLYTFR